MDGTSFVALYHGRTISSARLIAVSADPKLAANVAAQLSRQPAVAADGVVAELERGRRAALRKIAEADREPGA